MRALKRNTAGQKNRHLELGGVGRLVRWVLREASLGCGDEQSRDFTAVTEELCGYKGMRAAGRGKSNCKVPKG